METGLFPSDLSLLRQNTLTCSTRLYLSVTVDYPHHGWVPMHFQLISPIISCCLLGDRGSIVFVYNLPSKHTIVDTPTTKSTHGLAAERAHLFSCFTLEHFVRASECARCLTLPNPFSLFKYAVQVHYCAQVPLPSAGEEVISVEF